MQPNNYAFQASANMAEPMAQGMAQGLGVQNAKMTMRHAENQDRRAEESHAMSMAGKAAAMAQAQEQQARQAAFRSDMAAIYQPGHTPSFDEINALFAKYPEFQQQIQAGIDGIDERQRDGMMTSIGEIAFAIQSGNPEYAQQKAEEYATAADNSGDAKMAAMARAIAKQIETGGADGAMKTAMFAMAVMDPERAKTWMGMFGDAADRGPTRKSEIYNNGTTVRVFDTGTEIELSNGTIVTDPQEREAAIRAARESGIQQAFDERFAATEGTNRANIETGGAAAGAVRAGEIGQDIGLQAFEAAGNIRSNLNTIDQAIQAIDNGAKSGQIESRAPTWNAATIELRNLQSQLGLDVIGSVTFGALSEGELRLALQTALPTNLNEPDLRDWLVRKKAAQEKLLNYMEEQAKFLSRPETTLSMWLDKVDAGEVSASTRAATPDTTTTAPAPQTTPSADPLRDFLNSRGGN